MAATKSQGNAFAIFMVGATVATAGIAYISSGSGILTFIVGLLVLAISGAYFLKIKPEEGKTPDGKQPALLKLAGLVSALGGWVVVLFGLHLSSGVSGRMLTTVLGLAISLAGVLVIMPLAANKNAIWKA